MSRRARKYEEAAERKRYAPVDDGIDWDAVAERPEQKGIRTNRASLRWP